ncbi:MAG: nicotinate-nucleotide--dimethylbenzimidazole phosphoribosyltransferase, partial [Firmicutes bacterium]|nr:nicotinate-nucleotide--dimethylbenzimidazole phosphoribosyltransferase [Bacillota bacterium]
GRGAGLSNEKTAHKCGVIKKALEKYDFDGNDILNVLSIFGGYDIAGMIGAILAAAQFKKPVVVDGLITLAAVFAAEKLFNGVKDICIPSHRPREKTGRLLLEKLGLDAPIDADMALGEGTGAVLLLPQLDVCLALYNNGRRFEGLGIDAYKRF